MAGHSKWANIKHRKQGADKKRSALFHRISKELIVAARQGGPDPQSNSRLRIAMARARSANMPKDNIERAIKKGTGELDGVSYEEICYEAFGAGGVGIIIDSLTDKKSRTTPEIKNILGKHNANLAETNSVSRLFQQQGLIIVDCERTSEDKCFEIVAAAGAIDMRKQGDIYVITTTQTDFPNVTEALIQKNIEITEAELRYAPIEGTEVTAKSKDQEEAIFNLIEVLESHDDVQSVYTNLADLAAS